MCFSCRRAGVVVEPPQHPAHQKSQHWRKLLGYVQFPAHWHRSAPFQVQVKGAILDKLLDHDVWNTPQAVRSYSCSQARCTCRNLTDLILLLAARTLTPYTRMRCLCENWLIRLAASKKDWEETRSAHHAKLISYKRNKIIHIRNTGRRNIVGRLKSLQSMSDRCTCCLWIDEKRCPVLGCLRISAVGDPPPKGSCGWRRAASEKQTHASRHCAGLICSL